MRLSLYPWFWMAAVVGLLSMAYASFGGSSLLFLLVTACLILLQGAVVQAGSPARVVVHRDWLLARSQTGETGRLNYEIQFEGGLPPLWINLEDPLVGTAGRMGSLKVFAGFRRRVVIQAAISDLCRGVYAGGQAVITYGDIFGWFQRSLLVEVKGKSLVVLPRTRLLQEGLVKEESGSGEAPEHGLHGREQGGLIREYRPGDPWKSIHWKSSARKSDLFTCQSETSGFVDRIILLGTDPLSYTPKAVEFEDAISYAASLLRAELKAGKKVGLTFGGLGGRQAHICEPGREEGMDYLAAVTLDRRTRGEHLLIETVQEYSQAEVICILGEITREFASAAASAAARGCRVEIVLIRPGEGTNAGNIYELQADIIVQLRDTGIPVTQLTAPGSSSVQGKGVYPDGES